MGDFVPSGVVRIADHPINRIGQITIGESPPFRREALVLPQIPDLPRSMGQGHTLSMQC
jgi:hypothetical protein